MTAHLEVELVDRAQLEREVGEAKAINAVEEWKTFLEVDALNQEGQLHWDKSTRF